jgi:hypothetical protein
MKIRKCEKAQELFEDFIRTYDEAAEGIEQRKKIKMIDIVLAVFIIIIICMVSVRP